MYKHPLIIQFDLHQRLYNNVLRGFSEEESNSRLHGYPYFNPVKYIAGHLLSSQYGIAGIAGIKPEEKWSELFAVMGRSSAQDDIQYPRLEEILMEWNGLYEPVRNGLLMLNEEILADPPPQPFDKVSNSKGQLWAFISHHQAYHIGQIGLLRRAFKKEPMRFD